ncbi:MAG: zinc ribbon domain-containing protein [Thermoplasmata archaeon]|nr:MAG: zinc ribbon domain-containing protein [Thermoplasmata archaeon]
MVFCQNCGSPVVGEICPNCGQAVAQIPEQQQAQPMPGQPPKSNTVKIVMIIVVVVAVIVILAVLFLFLPGSKDSKESDGDKPEGYVFEMTDTDTMEVDAKGEVKGNKAKEFREVIDEVYGDDDGEVSSSEVNNYEKEIKDLLIGRHSSHEINDYTGKYTHYNEKITGAEGNIDSDDPIQGEFTATIFWSYIDTDEYSYDIELYVSSNLTDDFKFISPPGYEIDYIDGLDDEEYSDGSTIVEGKLSKEVIQITIVKIGESNSTPRGSLTASIDPTVANRYKLSFEGKVNNAEITISLYDESQGATVIMDTPEDGDSVSISGGAYLNYTDVSVQGFLDSSDTLILEGGGTGDIIRITYNATGETVAVVTIE